MINIGTLELADAYVESTPIEKAYIGSQLVWEKNPGPQPEPYDLYMWLDGNDAPVSSKWVDKEGGLQWTITGATHGGTYYEFLNPTSGTGNKYLSLAGGGASVNLGKHWKVVADVEIANNTQGGYVIDLCSYGSTSSGYNGLGLSFYKDVGPTMNVKRGGNTGTTTYTAEGIVIPLDESWNRMTLMWECVPDGDGKSVINAYLGSMLTRYTVDFNTIEWTKFRQGSSPYNTLYIGRGALNTSSNKAPLRFRLYDLKIYKRVED